MKRKSLAVALLPMLAFTVAGQEVTTWKSTVPSKVMGSPVKGAPYSADEITESSQVLADGTHITNKTQVTVYRDGEGRVRRESPKEISIWDPVENVSYTLNPQTMTAIKSSLARTAVAFTTSGGTAVKDGYVDYVFVTNSDSSAMAAKRDAEVAAVQTAKRNLDESMNATLDKLKAELAASQNGWTANGEPANQRAVAVLKDQLAVATQKTSNGKVAGKSEALGQQVIQGLVTDGTRNTNTIETGAIGNDRPINIVSERWYSQELQTVVMTKHTDPRSGEESFRLDNVRRGEPGADRFMVPPGYQLQDLSAGSYNKMIPAKKEQ